MAMMLPPREDFMKTETETETETSISPMQNFILCMNQMLANLVINEEENKRIREQFQEIKAKYEKETEALVRTRDAYHEAGFSYFSSNQYELEYQEMKERIEALAIKESFLYLIERMKKDFGEQSALVPIKDFKRILLKYNLVCGRMDEYCGTVPLDKLANITRIRKLINDSFYWKHSIINPDELLTKTVADFALGKVSNRRNNMFIAAPRECFEFRPENLDPLVCCLTEYGVMILESWDIEAGDKTLAYFREQESMVSLATLMNKIKPVHPEPLRENDNPIQDKEESDWEILKTFFYSTVIGVAIIAICFWLFG